MVFQAAYTANSFLSASFFAVTASIPFKTAHGPVLVFVAVSAGTKGIKMLYGVFNGLKVSR